MGRYVSTGVCLFGGGGTLASAPLLPGPFPASGPSGFPRVPPSSVTAPFQVLFQVLQRGVYPSLHRRGGTSRQDRRHAPPHPPRERVPPPPLQYESKQCYAAGGTPFALTQEDFLVLTDFGLTCESSLNPTTLDKAFPRFTKMLHKCK